MTLHAANLAHRQQLPGQVPVHRRSVFSGSIDDFRVYVGASTGGQIVASTARADRGAGPAASGQRRHRLGLGRFRDVEQARRAWQIATGCSGGCRRGRTPRPRTSCRARMRACTEPVPPRGRPVRRDGPPPARRPACGRAWRRARNPYTVVTPERAGLAAELRSAHPIRSGRIAAAGPHRRDVDVGVAGRRPREEFDGATGRPRL